MDCSSGHFTIFVVAVKVNSYCLFIFTLYVRFIYPSEQFFQRIKKKIGKMTFDIEQSIYTEIQCEGEHICTNL